VCILQRKKVTSDNERIEKEQKAVSEYCLAINSESEPISDMDWDQVIETLVAVKTMYDDTTENLNPSVALNAQRPVFKIRQNLNRMLGKLQQAGTIGLPGQHAEIAWEDRDKNTIAGYYAYSPSTSEVSARGNPPSTGLSSGLLMFT